MRVDNDKLRIIAEAIFNAKLRYGIAVYFKPRLKEGDDHSRTSTSAPE